MVLLTEVNVLADWLVLIVFELRTVLKLVVAIFELTCRIVAAEVTFVVELFADIVDVFKAEVSMVVLLVVVTLINRVLVTAGVNVKLEAFLVVEPIGNVPVVNGYVTFEAFLVVKIVTVPEIVLFKICGALVKLTANGVVAIKVELEAFLVVKLVGNVPVVNEL